MSQHCSDIWYMSIPSAQPSREETFFKKIHPCGKSCKYYTSRVLYIPFTIQILQSSYLAKWARTINRKRFFGTKPLKCRRYGITIIYRTASKVKTENPKSIQKNLHISEKITTFAAKYIANQFKSYEKNNPIWHGARSTQRMLQTRTNIRLHRGQVL